MAKSSCGTHTELASNDAVRVTKCPCGTVHMTLVSSGVTVRMNADVLRNATIGLKAAVERMDPPRESIPSPAGSTSIN